MKCFLRRKSDGRFYRGARFWRWCRSWRHAAFLEKSFWKTFVLPKIDVPCEMVTIEQIDTDEGDAS